MNAKERIICIRLIELIRDNNLYAGRIGLEATTRKRVRRDTVSDFSNVENKKIVVDCPNRAVLTSS